MITPGSAMEPEPQREAAAPTADGSDDGSLSGSGGGWEDDFEDEAEQAAIAAATAAAAAEAAAAAAPPPGRPVRKVKGRGARRFDARESAYELGRDRLASEGAEPAAGDERVDSGSRQPHVLEVVMQLSGSMEPEQSNMLVLREVEELAAQCASAGVETTVRMQWLPAAADGGGALAIFQSAAAANAVLRAAAAEGSSSLCRLVAYDDASDRARSVPVERLAPTARRATSSAAASRMLTGALGLPKVRSPSASTAASAASAAATAIAAATLPCRQAATARRFDASNT
jgi:hypothetical protein